MTGDQRDLDALARLIYETATEGYDGHPAWSDLSYPRQYRWLQAAKKAWTGVLLIEEGRERSHARVVRIDRQQEEAG